MYWPSCRTVALCRCECADHNDSQAVEKEHAAARLRRGFRGFVSCKNDLEYNKRKGHKVSSSRLADTVSSKRRGMS